jgi:hypothetical protein
MAHPGNRATLPRAFPSATNSDPGPQPLLCPGPLPWRDPPGKCRTSGISHAKGRMAASLLRAEATMRLMVPSPDSLTASCFAASIISGTGTLLGHEASQARQLVHVANRSLTIEETGSLPSTTALMSAIRPRAESDSDRSRMEGGQTDRHDPHFTQREISLPYCARSVLKGAASGRNRFMAGSSRECRGRRRCRSHLDRHC